MNGLWMIPLIHNVQLKEPEESVFYLGDSVLQSKESSYPWVFWLQSRILSCVGLKIDTHITLSYQWYGNTGAKRWAVFLYLQLSSSH